MDLEDVRVRGIRKSGKEKSCMIPLVGSPSRQQIHRDKAERWDAGAGAGRRWSSRVIGQSSVSGEENLLQLDGAGGCAATWTLPGKEGCDWPVWIMLPCTGRETRALGPVPLTRRVVWLRDLI